MAAGVNKDRCNAYGDAGSYGLNQLRYDLRKLDAHIRKGEKGSQRINTATTLV